MTYFKIIFLLIMAMLEKCHIVNKRVEPLLPKPSEVVENRDSTDITGSWQWQQVSVTKGGNKIERSLDSIQKPKKVIPLESTLLSFFQDSTFTEIQRNGTYRYGTYALTGKSLSLKFESTTQRFGVAFDTISRVHRVLNLEEEQKDKSRQFVENAFPLKKIEEDPFYHSNNAWRIKPDGPESQQQIQARLTNYLKHSCTVFKAAMDRNQSSLSWVFSEGIIEIYSRGIGSVAPDALPESWVNTFYSREDAVKAYNLFERYLRSGKSKVTSTGDWVKDDYHILLNIYEQAQSQSVLQ